ncbi:hypothetical protein B296_00008866 [Ensete ventricosum]|uniref:Uncharacterized protein n=1 Tax=Ensete ventricosum TaxID=4639 RepID=A0A427AWR8_ENSVE|nr:hypothetical protein B296_00008866 [Ensete ventricosum]
MTGAIELQQDDGSRSILGIGPGSDEGIEKLAGNTLGDPKRRLEDSSQECRRLLDWREWFKPKFEKWREPLL